MGLKLKGSILKILFSYFVIALFFRHRFSQYFTSSYILSNSQGISLSVLKFVVFGGGAESAADRDGGGVLNGGGGGGPNNEKIFLVYRKNIQTLFLLFFLPESLFVWARIIN